MNINMTKDLNAILRSIKQIDGGETGDTRIRIKLSDDSVITMEHHQDCCESVYLDEFDSVDSLQELVGRVLYSIESREEEMTSENCRAESFDSGTWTFYHLKTSRGDVTLTWRGESNGYYSESVDIKWEE